MNSIHVDSYFVLYNITILFFQILKNYTFSQKLPMKIGRLIQEMESNLHGSRKLILLFSDISTITCSHTRTFYVFQVS